MGKKCLETHILKWQQWCSLDGEIVDVLVFHCAFLHFSKISITKYDYAIRKNTINHFLIKRIKKRLKLNLVTEWQVRKRSKSWYISFAFSKFWYVNSLTFSSWILTKLYNNKHYTINWSRSTFSFNLRKRTW